jgi:hypothetical protein
MYFCFVMPEKSAETDSVGRQRTMGVREEIIERAFPLAFAASRRNQGGVEP